jgi:RNA polymerase sigma-70 factor (ECF subfamily)
VSEISNEELLLAYRDGDRMAFRTLFQRFRVPLYNFLLRRVRDRERAEELYQDVWAKVIERCEEFRGESKFSTWLYTIARNRVIDHSRRMKFRTYSSLDAPRHDSGAPLVEHVANPGPSTADLAEGQTLQDRIAEAVEELPEDQREVFLMRQLQGLKFQEIAEVVDVPVNTVKSRMRYALERLQHQLGDLREQSS